MTNESVKIEGWTFQPHFDRSSGKLLEIELSFMGGLLEICEIRVPNVDERIVVLDSGIGLCLKPVDQEEKYGSWLEINPARSDLFGAINEWLGR